MPDSSLISTLDEVEGFILFLGNSRSGSTILGSILGHHTDVVIAHEFSALGRFRQGLEREAFLQSVLERASWFLEQNESAWEGYSYQIGEGPPSGSKKKPRYLGDKKAAASAIEYQKSPGVLSDFEHFIGVPVYIVNVNRNPFDTIARMALKAQQANDWSQHQAQLDRAGFFKRNIEAVQRIKAEWPEERFYSLTLENLIADPHAGLVELCGFLGIDASPEYLQACAASLFEKPNLVRDQVDWSAEVLDLVNECISSNDLLVAYEAAE